MPSTRPRDAAKTFVNPRLTATVQRWSGSLGLWTANTTVTPTARFIADRRLVIREVWFVLDAIPSDPDGTMLVNALAFDNSEAADDSIVASHDTEAVHLVANKAYKAALVAETTENERTLEEGDSLRFTLVNNSAAITTNPNVNVTVLYQVIKAL